MQKNEHPVLDRLTETVDEIHVLQDRIMELKERLRHDALAIEGVEPGSTRLDIAAYAYWYLPEVPAEELAFAVTKRRRNIQNFLKLVGPVVSNLSCTRCSEGLQVTSRTDMQRVLADIRSDCKRRTAPLKALCDRCRKAESVQWRAEAAKNQLARLARYEELRNMPYEEYRQTKDWQQKRQEYFELRHFIFGPGTRLTCEACDACTEGLDVFHKSIDRPGEEAISDLILLCAECRDLLRLHGKLAA